MLGRHVYRAHRGDKRWSVTKEGEEKPRGDFADREKAIAEACRLAEADQPSRVTVDNGDGVLEEERLFGTDLSQELDSPRVMPASASLADRIALQRGDLTWLAVDAIVNAANSSLLGGGGVDGAIHRAAGPDLLAACRSLGGCPPGEARLTGGYRLSARHVIHTVGPIWRGGDAGEREILESCYGTSLAIALRQGFADLAFPAIATGVYGFPHDEAARIAVGVVRGHLARYEAPQRVIFVCFEDVTFTAYRRALGREVA